MTKKITTVQELRQILGTYPGYAKVMILDINDNKTHPITEVSAFDDTSLELDPENFLTIDFDTTEEENND